MADEAERLLAFVAQLGYNAARRRHQQQQRRLVGWMLVVLVGVGVGVWYVTRTATIEEFAGFQRLDDPTAKALKAFWPNEPLRAEGKGYLTSKNLIPLRAIARRPNLDLFSSPALKYPAEVVGVMEPWVPYYVFEKKGDALQIGPTALTKEAERHWVAMDQVFCWATREALSIEKPVPLYRSIADAQKGENPVTSGFRYPFAENFVTGGEKAAKQRFKLAALPVVARQDGSYWGVVSPEGSQQGYELRWLKWDGTTADVEVRMRTTRQELEFYLADLQRLLKEWKIQEKRDKAHRELYATAVDYRARDKAEYKADATGLKHLQTRRDGIVRLDGILERPIESELQYDKLSERTIEWMKLSSSPMWDVWDVAYPPSKTLP